MLQTCHMLHTSATFTCHATYFYHITLHVTYLCHRQVACDILLSQTLWMWHTSATNTMDVTYFCHRHVGCDILLPKTRWLWHTSTTNTLYVTYFCHRHVGCNTLLPQTRWTWRTSATNTLHMTYYCHKHVACNILYNKQFAYYIRTYMVNDMPHFAACLCHKRFACDELTPHTLCVWYIYATDTLHVTYL